LAHAGAALEWSASMDKPAAGVGTRKQRRDDMGSAGERFGGSTRMQRPRVRWMRLGALALGLASSAAVAQDSAAAFVRSFEPGEPSSLIRAPSAASSAGAFGLDIASGPARAAVLTAMPGVGFSGLHALHYAGAPAAAGTAAQSVALFDVDIPVRSDTRLSYVIFPQSVQGDLRNPANYVAVDLLFDDGSRLSQRAAEDQHRIAMTASAQGRGRVLYPDQWNAVSADLAKVAAGRTIRRVLVVHDDAANRVSFEGYLDDIRIGPAPSHPAGMHPSDFVNTLRGTNSNGHFSRGNNFPAVAVPHGFNFWTPTTNAGSNWIYQYQERNGADNRPRLEALSLSHEPSPWMGDRQTFQVMPAAVAHGAPSADRAARALPFDHANEVAHADYYRVRFDNGITAEITPTDHAAMMRFTFAAGRSQLVFDNQNDHGGIVLDPGARAISGWSDVKSRLSTGATRMYFYAVFDRPVSDSGRLAGAGRDHVEAWFGFDTRDARRRAVTMRIATSLIGVAQARHNLALEIAPGDTFDSLRDRARRLWDARLGIVEVEGASADEKTTLYSNLYRLFLYPNSAFENTGSRERPAYRYASPFAAAVAADSPTHTGARVMEGKVYVNNGLWDTYRTAWPAYALLAPTEAGAMIDGFVQQYRDSGWIARWSSPGYADLMVGTSADVAFADAWLKGVRNFDVQAFYQAALKDATVVSPIAGTGRKGMQRSPYLGYTDNGVDEGLSWSMAGYLNDFAIGNLAAALAARKGADDPYQSHYADDARYFHDRALDYARLFNPQAGFFIGRSVDGQWSQDPAHFDPLRWGGDYTETNAWNMAFDQPYDGAGLASLYGGRDKLAGKLDRLFATPGVFHVGSYGDVIHEMLEARDVRMGQYGHSNQPSHHLIYMYDLAGQPWKTQDKVRDALSRLYVGSEIGQGYPGDADNGEMSAWWLFSAAGFYPLRMGTPTYAIGAPYFPHMTIHLENGRRIEIRAPQASDRNRYIQGVTLNGRPYERNYLTQADLADGAVLEFRMGPAPSHWGTAVSAALPSLSPAGMRPDPWRNLFQPGRDRLTLDGDGAAAQALADRTSATATTLAGGTPTLAVHFGTGAQRVQMYTLTSAAAANAAPRAWELQGSLDGTHWQVLDRREGESFHWPQQLRAFAVPRPGDFPWYRLRFDRDDGTQAMALSEVQWLGHPASAAPAAKVIH
jgi:predicted alpha-1,2-mannosidase